MRRHALALSLAAALASLGASELRAQHAEMTAAPGPTKAIAILSPTKFGGDAKGEVTFTKVAGGIKVEGEIRGLTPGLHGFHIHEFGDVSSPEALSAGGHFNPDKVNHAAPTDAKHHVGDLGNVEANAKGVAKINVVDPMLSFSGAHSILGRGLIVHEKADDLKGQPAGNAGNRVLAGVIGVAKPN